MVYRIGDTLPGHVGRSNERAYNLTKLAKRGDREGFNALFVGSPDEQQRGWKLVRQSFGLEV